MLSINMRIFKTVLFLIAICADVRCAPVKDSEEATTSVAPILPTTSSPATDHYDQRQNGTENYRIHLDGVVLVVAPVDALLLAGVGAASSGDPNLSVFGNQDLTLMKPTPAKPKPPVEDITKPTLTPKHAQRPGIRLANLIAPLLHRIRHE